MQKELESVATRLYLLSLITPLYTQLNASAVIRTIVHTTLIYAGCETELYDVSNYPDGCKNNDNNNNNDNIANVTKSNGDSNNNNNNSL